MTNNKPLSAVTNFISRGISPKYDDEGYVVINQRCIRNHRINFNVARFSNREKTRIKLDKLIQHWDILVNSTGVGTLGRVAQVTHSVKDVTVDSHVTIVRPNLEVLNGRYFGYALISRENFIETLGVGSTGQTELSRQRLSEVEIPVYHLPIQRKISYILSAYDDLIDNNLRRIKILEEMAQMVYHEWFVNLKFPGCENTEILKTEHGPTPKGWKYEPIGKVIETLGGGTPSTKNNEFWDKGNIEWFTPSDLTSNNAMFITESSRKITKKGLQKSSAKLFPAYSVMMTSRATLGVVSINTKEACTNQGFITCVPNEKLSKYYLYFWIKQNVEIIINLASGATFKEINKTTFRKIPILIPDSETMILFIEKMEPIGALIENLLKKNKNLQKCRDMLLSKLISGEIDISNIDIAV